MAFEILRKKHAQRTRGFTLVELVVISGIIVIVSGIVLASNSRFGGVILLENLGYDVALSVRQAQVYGISVARYGTSNFSAGYGVHFQTGSDTYVLFGDVIAINGMYDCPQPGSGNCELVASNTIAHGYSVSALCAPAGTTLTECTVNGSSLQKASIDVLFQRPEPDAWISAAGASCTITLSNCKESARIVLTSPRGDHMSVIVEANGQISVRRGDQ